LRGSLEERVLRDDRVAAVAGMTQVATGTQSAGGRVGSDAGTDPPEPGALAAATAPAIRIIINAIGRVRRQES